MNLSAVEWVRFYEQFWVVYTIVLGIAFWFFKLAELEDNRIKWEIINLIIVGSFIGYKLWWKINKERKGEVSRKYTQENVTKQWFLRAEYIKCRQFYFWCIIFWMLIFALMVKISSLKREFCSQLHEYIEQNKQEQIKRAQKDGCIFLCSFCLERQRLRCRSPPGLFFIFEI